jgi:omega-6 fatty acid desaturase (delta-12 desaturase)
VKALRAFADPWPRASRVLATVSGGLKLAGRPVMARSDKEILDATRPFAAERSAESWAHTLVALCLVGLAGWSALRLPWMPARIASSLLEGLLLVRLFILFHDFYHGAILRGSRAARVLFWTYGQFVLTPPKVWRQTHNYHHAHNGKIVGSHVGAYPVVTLAMWTKMSSRERFRYRASRHPSTIALGLLTVFAWGMCISPFLRDRRRNASALLPLTLQLVLAWAVVHTLGWGSYGLVILVPLAIATASGAYLFYAQHNFPGVYFQPRDGWNYVRAALESSSYMPMGRVAAFFTGNIGFHHVHHLNPSIPFYRLPDAMTAIPELRSPKTTTLTPRDIASCFRLDIWDPAEGRMVAARSVNEGRA